MSLLDDSGIPACYSDQLGAEEQKRLNKAAYDIRRLVTRMISMCNWGHIGGSYSVAEIMAVLYGHAAFIDATRADDPKRDYVVLSKAHCSPALYAAMCVFGMLPEEALYTYGTVGGLDGHLCKNKPRGVECSGGSLGLGLSYCVGVAAGLKQQQCYCNRVYCLVGDGELNEGQMWEAMQFAVQYRLNNLIVIIDNNKVMAKSYTHEGIGVAPLYEKLSAFGFNVRECNGHNVNELWRAMYSARYIDVNGRPNAIIADTVKGRGVSDCEFNYRWHTHAPDIKTANAFLQELAGKWGQEYIPIEKAVKGSDPGLAGVILEDT